MLQRPVAIANVASTPAVALSRAAAPLEDSGRQQYHRVPNFPPQTMLAHDHVLGMRAVHPSNDSSTAMDRANNLEQAISQALAPFRAAHTKEIAAVVDIVLRAQKAHFETDVAALSKTNGELRNENAGLQTHTAALEKSVDCLRKSSNRMTASVARIGELERKAATLEAENERLLVVERAEQKARTLAQKDSKAAQEKNKSLESQATALETTSSELLMENAALRLLKGRLQRTNVEVEEKNTGLESRAAALEKTNNENTGLQAQTAALQKTNRELREQNTGLESQAIALEKTNGELREENTGLKSQKAGLNDRMSASAARAGELERKAATAVAENERLLKEGRAVREEKLALAQEVKDLRRTLGYRRTGGRDA